MWLCPRCKQRLVVHARGRVCTGCRGESVPLSAMLEDLDPGLSARLMAAARSPAARHRLHCPTCFSKMGEVLLGSEEAGFTVDLCRRCKTLWLDAGEGKQVRKSQPVLLGDERSEPVLRARKELVLWSMREAKELRAPMQPPSTMAGRWLGYAGFRVFARRTDWQSLPLVTWALCFALAFTSWLVLPDLDAFEGQVFSAERAWQAPYVLAPLLSALLHASYLHLAGNLYMLLVVGPDVEDLLGHVGMLGLIFGSVLLSSALHAMVDPRPVVGASAIVSSLLVCYALAFPEARVHRFWWRAGQWFSLPVIYVTALWFGLQVLGMLTQSQGFTRISHAGHVGGAMAGLLAWAWFRSVARAERPRT